MEKLNEFMDKVYSNPNFPVILFSLIGLLLAAFIITLILAIRDAKKNKMKLVSETKDALEFNSDNAIELVNETKEVEEEKVFEDIVFDVKSEPSKEEVTFDSYFLGNDNTNKEAPVGFELPKKTVEEEGIKDLKKPVNENTIIFSAEELEKIANDEFYM